MMGKGKKTLVETCQLLINTAKEFRGVLARDAVKCESAERYNRRGVFG
jgi:hypothetical protein